MTRKITLLGAGSSVFAKTILGDILSYPELSNSTIFLYDIDPKRLEDTLRILNHISAKLGVSPHVQISTDLQQSLSETNYAINMIQVGGYDPSTLLDFEIPKKYKLRQTIGDTLGIGGIMRGLRTIPVMLEMVHLMESICPDVLHLNYVNPLAINTWALNRASSVKTIGLCHSVPHTTAQIAADLRLPADEITYLVAGINHLAFYLRLEREGLNLYPQLKNVISEGRVPDWNRVRYDFFKRLGYFVTESSEHLSEYVPWYIKNHRPDLIDRYNIPLDEYLFRCQAQIKIWDAIKVTLEKEYPTDEINIRNLLAEIPLMPSMVDSLISTYQNWSEIKPSSEYAGQIIHSIETDNTRTVYCNVMNNGLIDNLPQDCCVEVPCSVNADGIKPEHIGNLPVQLAAVIQTHINVQRLTIEAALTLKRDYIYHAAMFDPHTSAELDLDQIYSMVDELLEAHGDMLPDYH
jgi:alpha-galactosidase